MGAAKIGSLIKQKRLICLLEFLFHWAAIAQPLPRYFTRFMEGERGALLDMEMRPASHLK